MGAIDPVVLARLQFAANVTFHILFPTVSIALGWPMVAGRRVPSEDVLAAAAAPC